MAESSDVWIGKSSNLVHKGNYWMRCGLGPVWIGPCIDCAGDAMLATKEVPMLYQMGMWGFLYQLRVFSIFCLSSRIFPH